MAVDGDFGAAAGPAPPVQGQQPAAEAAVSAAAAEAQARAAKAREELLAYLVATEGEGSALATELGERHGVKHALVVDIFNNVREQALRKRKSSETSASSAGSGDGAPASS